MVRSDGFPLRVDDQVIQSSEDHINRVKDAGLVLSPEARIASGVLLLDLDHALIERAMAAGGFSGSVEEYLLARRLADSRGHDLTLRRGASWLFGRTPQTIEHPNAGLRIFRVHGTEQRPGAQRNV